MKLGCIGTTALPLVAERFDCRAGAAAWQKAWTLRKRQWCCHHQSVACPVSLVGRVLTTPSGTLAPFDCAAGKFESWAAEKRAWCCLHHSQGCSQSTTMIRASSNLQDSVPRVGVSATSLYGEFDCIAGFSNWNVLWSREKKRWCCSHHSRGCLPNLQQSHVDKPQSNFGAQHNHDCGGDHQTTWSAERVHWCCKYVNIGCERTPGLHLETLQKFSQQPRTRLNRLLFNRRLGGGSVNATGAFAFAALTLCSIGLGCFARRRRRHSTYVTLLLTDTAACESLTIPETA